MKEDYNPLVTIGVLTYNSSKYVLETLESAKAQTYKNIELIISDDCSKDNTIELCREWVDKNKERFVRCEILTVEKNTGIPANCNRRLRASKGEWIKGIAGDDILAPDCIENFINFVKENPDAEWVSSHIQDFKDVFCRENFTTISDRSNLPLFAKGVTAEAQYLFYLKAYGGGTPSFFFKKEALEKAGGYDERFPLIEDYPMALRLTKTGVKQWYMPKVTVFYRIHSASVFNGQMEGRLFNQFYKVRFDFDREYLFASKSNYQKLLYYRNYYTFCLADMFGLNKQRFVCRTLFRIFYWGGRPILLFRLLREKIWRRLR